MGRIQGKVVIVTGCAGVLGSAQSQMLAVEGGRLLVGDIDDDRGAALAQKITRAGHTARFIHLDVTKESDWATITQEAVTAYGRLDVLVNNAGSGLPRRLIEDRSLAEWDWLMALNATSVFLGTKYAVPEMKRSSGGSIVNISSIAALGLFGMTEATYAASKAAVQVFSRATAAQYGKENIRCNSLHPGPIDSELVRQFYASPEAKAERLSHIPLGRFGRPDEIAAAVLFLASDEASYVSGTALVVDGASMSR